MNEDVFLCVERMVRFFPQSFVYKSDELIVEPKNNIYFRIDDIDGEIVFNCKVVEWLSRPAHKGVSKIWQARIRKGMNGFLGTEFTPDDLAVIYTKLGNSCNRTKTIEFILSGYDIETLRTK